MANNASKFKELVFDRTNAAPFFFDLIDNLNAGMQEGVSFAYDTEYGTYDIVYTQKTEKRTKKYIISIEDGYCMITCNEDTLYLSDEDHHKLYLLALGYALDRVTYEQETINLDNDMNYKEEVFDLETEEYIREEMRAYGY